jgi:hypothetical protein
MRARLKKKAQIRHKSPGNKNANIFSFRDTAKIKQTGIFCDKLLLKILKVDAYEYMPRFHII